MTMTVASMPGQCSHQKYAPKLIIGVWGVKLIFCAQQGGLVSSLVRA